MDPGCSETPRGRLFVFNGVCEVVLVDDPARAQTDVINAGALIGHHA
jgi:hypothetical protein